MITPEVIARNVHAALAEDIGDGDLTAMLIPEDNICRAQVICRESAILCGSPWFELSFKTLDERVHIEWLVPEGGRLHPDQPLCMLEGPARAVLTGERTALNFLQTLSGTATVTRRFVDAVTGTGTHILDTRKTLPGLRLAQKYAVTQGGGHNHRLGLYDAFLIKENHIMAAGSIGRAVAAARKLRPSAPVEVETENLDEVRQALAAGADIIMLDEFDLDSMRDAVAMVNHACRIEASGSVRLDNVRSIAETGVDYISIGSLTKHIQAVDLSLRII